MYILGINISHHSSSCLLKDGEVVYFIENDRLTRKKLYGYQEFYKSIGDEDISTPYYPGLKKLLEHTNELDYIIFTSYGQENVDKDVRI
jgi:predicted NodU family carbamoyl transferase